MKIITTENIPIKLWLDDIEPGALQQAMNLANHPFAYRHIAIMPDAHEGYGMPIGGVLAARDVVIPNAVGVDIGCGMCAVKTNTRGIEIDTLKRIRQRIKDVVPVGFEHHKKGQGEHNLPMLGDDMPIAEREFESALRQVGTLGGGNHFIEIQQDDDDIVWIMIHSGSRNIGKQVADHYNKRAIELNEKRKAPIPKSWQLAYLEVDSREGQRYLAEMQYCVDFAFLNRSLMMKRAMEIFSDETGAVGFEPMINIAHNYASFEKHFGRDVVVHRKGATAARDGETGIIPGSQGAASYIVTGIGNPESFKSCSHGAGRRLGRNQARQQLDLKEEINRLDKAGVLHSLRGKNDLDEASSAYKNIDMVMKQQQDLVRIKVRLMPRAVIKG